MSSYRWTILGVGVGAQAALSAVQMGLPALAPELRERFDLSLSEVGLVLAAFGFGILTTLLVWGWLADSIGERTVISTGLGLSSGALVAAAYAPDLTTLLVALVVAGMLGSSAAAASGRAVMGWFPRTERGFALGIRQMAVPLGGAVAAISLPALVGAGGLKAALLALAGGSLAGAVASWRWIREPPPALANRPARPTTAPLSDPRVWRLSLGSAFLVCAQVAMVSFVVLFLHDEHGISAGTAALALATIQVGGALSRLGAGRRSDRLGRRIAPLRRHGLAMAAALLATGALAGGPLVVLLPVLLIAGVLTMSWNGLSFTAAAEMAGRDRAGTALGLQGTVMRTLSAGAGVGFGALVAATSWSAGFALLAALPLAGYFLLTPLVEEEEDRIDAREARLAGARPANLRAA